MDLSIVPGSLALSWIHWTGRTGQENVSKKRPKPSKLKRLPKKVTFNFFACALTEVTSNFYACVLTAHLVELEAGLTKGQTYLRIFEGYNTHAHSFPP
jgi:hypothetical protein